MTAAGERALKCANEGDLKGLKELLSSEQDQSWIHHKDDEWGWTPLHWACIKGHLEVVKLLEEKGANINCADKSGWTPLHCACIKGHLEVAKLLISSGANVNCTYKDGRTPLHWACIKGHLEVVKLLEEKGANINCADKSGWTPLHCACIKGHLEVAKLLISSGANINCADKYDRTPLHLACINGHLEVVKHLASSGATINCADKDGYTPVDFAAQNDCSNLIEYFYLLDGLPQPHGDSVLHRVCRQQKLDMAVHLVEMGADPTKKNDEKKQPIDLLNDEITSAKLLEIRLKKVDQDRRDQEKKKKTKATALNDGAKGGVDRFNYTSYAHALANVLKGADLPVCVGLYAKWGSGKSFMIHLLKQYLDESELIGENERTNDVQQWFEKEEQPVSSVKKRQYPGFCSHEAWSNRLGCLASLVWLPNWLRSVPTFYTLSTLVSILSDIMIDLWNGFLTKCFEIIFGSTHYPYKPMPDDGDNDYVDRAEGEDKSKYDCCSSFCSSSDDDMPVEMETEYIFVDYNAWEFSGSDELWVGLIRNIYAKVELRLSKHSQHPNLPKHTGKSSDKEDYKRKWRVHKAKKVVEDRLGGRNYLRLYLLSLLVVLSGILTVVVASALQGLEFWRQLERHIGKVVAAVVVLVLSVYPAFQLLRGAAQDSGTSRGEVLYAEAESIHDRTGFMSKVREELDELFEFMSQYKEETGFDLKLVLFVDDLDRCLEGRNVKVLQALQLVLDVPGAPVITFLAIDSTVLVSSIETVLNRSLNTTDALITGWEYLDKIVQLPFCLPEAPPEKVKRLVVSCLNKKPPSVEVVAGRLRQILSYSQEKATSSHMIVHPAEDQPAYSLHQFCSDMSATGVYDSFEKYSDLDLVQLAGALLTKECVNAVELVTHGSAEGEELLCERVNNLLCNISSFDAKEEATSDKDAPQSSGVNQAVERSQPFAERLKIARGVSGGQDGVIPQKGAEEHLPNTQNKENKNAMKSEDVDVVLLYSQKIKLEDVGVDAISASMKEALTLFSRFSDANPRRLKRIVNVIQIVSEVGRLKPVSLETPAKKLSHLDEWALFSRKLVKWIYLCENFPYRMSFLALFLLDWNQKKMFNWKAEKTKGRRLSDNNSLFSYRLFHTKQSDDATITLEKETNEGVSRGGGDQDTNSEVEEVQLNEVECLPSFYFKNVERYVHCIPSAMRLLRLDSDPEVFAIMLDTFVDNYDVYDITVQDVLGPLKEGGSVWDRDSNLSLLSYSFNLHPSLRRIIGTDMTTLISPYELCANGSDKQDLPRPFPSVAKKANVV